MIRFVFCSNMHLLVWILMAATTWQRSSAFDIFQDEHNPGLERKLSSPMQADRRYHTTNWEPSILWWKNKRSSQLFPGLGQPIPLSDLEALAVETRLPTLIENDPAIPAFKGDKLKINPDYNEVLQSDLSDSNPDLPTIPLARTSLEHSPQTVTHQALMLRKALRKLKKIEAIQKALKTRDKLEDAERRESKFVRTLLDDLREIKELERESGIPRQHKPAKSRRARLGEQFIYPGRQALPASGKGHFSPMYSRKPKILKSSFDSMGQTLNEGFHSYNQNNDAETPVSVEWFPNLSDGERPAYSKYFDEYFLPHDKPIHRQDDIFSESSSETVSPVFSDDMVLSGGFSDMPFNDFPDVGAPEAALMSSEETTSGDKKPVKQGSDGVTGFWEEGSFQDGNKDCDTIATKTCTSDLECSCHGFYVCNQGRCDIKRAMKHPSRDMWHEEPVDFGLTKRSIDKGLMSDALLQRQDNKRANVVKF